MPHLDDQQLVLLATERLVPDEEPTVRAHLSECSTCHERLELARMREEATQRTGPPPAFLPPPAPTVQRGSSVGRYLILHEVGKGGMGVVYAAHDPKLDRKVALKLLQVESGGGEEVAENRGRLVREAQAMARVSHPNVVAVHDAETYGDRVFVAMEYVDGTTLTEWQQTPRPWKQKLETYLAAGRGLAAAHAAGLVHRDFKPDNVLVSKEGRVQVTDFGLARLLSTAEAAPSVSGLGLPLGTQRLHTELTQAGVVAGTPNYMAPELYQGKPPDARSDQFSFCSALYFALYGQRPFQPRELAEAAVAGKAFHMREPPRTPRLPGWVRRAVLRGLSLAPQERFASMEALLWALSGPSTTVRRLRVAAMGALTVGLLLAVYQGLISQQAAACSGAERRLAGIWDVEVERRIEAAFLATGKSYAAPTWRTLKTGLEDYARRWVEVHTEACQATRVRGEQPDSVLALRMVCLEQRLKGMHSLTRQLVDADAELVARGVDVGSVLPDLKRCGDVEALLAQASPPDAPAARAEYERLSATLIESDTLLLLGRQKPARELLEPALAGARQLGYTPLLARALNVMGRMESAAGDARKSEQLLTEAVLTADVARDDEIRAYSAAALTYTAGALQRREADSEHWFRIAQAALDRIGGSDKYQLYLYLMRASALRSLSHPREALPLVERGLALCDKMGSDCGTRRPTLVRLLGSTYHDLGDLERAESLHRQALEEHERMNGPEHMNTGQALAFLATTLLAKGDAENANRCVQRSLAIMEAALGADNYRVQWHRKTLARTLTRLGRAAEALPVAQRALDLYLAKRGPEHPDAGYFYTAVAEAQLALGKPRLVLPGLERAVAGPRMDSEYDALSRFLLARALVELGKEPERARELAAKAHATFLAAGLKYDAQEVERWQRQRLQHSGAPAAAAPR